MALEVGLGLGCSPPSGTGLFWGGVCPQVPLHLRRGGHLGLFKVWPLRGRLGSNYLSGPLFIQPQSGVLAYRVDPLHGAGIRPRLDARGYPVQDPRISEHLPHIIIALQWKLRRYRGQRVFPFPGSRVSFHPPRQLWCCSPGGSGPAACRSCR